MKPKTAHLVKKTTTAIAASAMLTGALWAAQPALAAAQSPPDFDRTKVISRASRWAGARIPYSQQRSFEGYRTDCSGFVSMAWGLNANRKPVSLVTWTIPKIARPIKKEDLQPGDVMLAAVSNPSIRHVVIFGRWANKQKTAYVAYESAGSADRAIRRVVPYPYRITPHLYKPYRFTGTPSSWGGNSYIKRPMTAAQKKAYAAQQARAEKVRAEKDARWKAYLARNARRVAEKKARYARHQAAKKERWNAYLARNARRVAERQERWDRHLHPAKWRAIDAARAKNKRTQERKARRDAEQKRLQALMDAMRKAEAERLATAKADAEREAARKAELARKEAEERKAAEKAAPMAIFQSLIEAL